MINSMFLSSRVVVLCAWLVSKQSANCILRMPKLATGVMSTCLQGLCVIACCKPGLVNWIVPFLCNGHRRLMSRYTRPSKQQPAFKNTKYILNLTGIDIYFSETKGEFTFLPDFHLIL